MAWRGTKKKTFCDSNVEYAPKEPGVYALYVEDELVYYGSTNAEKEESIHGKLLAHLIGEKEPSKVTHYAYEVGVEKSRWEDCWPEDWDRAQLPPDRSPRARQTELIVAYFQMFGRTPKFNPQK